MKTATEHIARTLLDARKRKGLSQRALADLAGVPQSHISKIESGAVDLRLSSLIELSRALGLELELVPRSAVPAVQSIVRSVTSSLLPTRWRGSTSDHDSPAVHLVDLPYNGGPRPRRAYTLNEDGDV